MSKTIVILASLAFAAGVAFGNDDEAAPGRDKDKVTALSAAAASARSGKVLAVTRHEKPSFSAMTAGKAGLGMVGAFAMLSAGNKIVNDNGIADPADILEQ